MTVLSENGETNIPVRAELKVDVSAMRLSSVQREDSLQALVSETCS